MNWYSKFFGKTTDGSEKQNRQVYAEKITAARDRTRCNRLRRIG